jgi:hypothetical protein
MPWLAGSQVAFSVPWHPPALISGTPRDPVVRSLSCRLHGGTRLHITADIAQYGLITMPCSCFVSNTLPCDLEPALSSCRTRVGSTLHVSCTTGHHNDATISKQGTTNNEILFRRADRPTGSPDHKEQTELFSPADQTSECHPPLAFLTSITAT